MHRVKSPRAAFLIFTSGKVVCTGAKNVEDVGTVITNMAKTLKVIGFDKIDLNLNAIALGLGLKNIEYEPEQFPRLVYRIKQPKVVVLIFSSGKLVVTGGKSPSEDLLQELLAKSTRRGNNRETLERERTICYQDN